MSYNEIPDLDSKGLRQFGLMLGSILSVVFGFFLPWSWKWESQPNLVWIGIGFAVVTWALIAPDSMRSLYRSWMRVALKIGHVVNSVILAIVYFIVITPIGIVMRMMGKDPMHLRLDEKVASYRIISKVRDRTHVERPY